MRFQSRCLIVAAALSAASCTAASLQAGSAAARDLSVPGATGQVVVIGSSSTIAGDVAATRMQQTGSYGG
jgi:hypothetical protein